MFVEKKRLELEFMLAEQTSAVKAAAGEEEDTTFQDSVERIVDDNSFLDKGLLPPPVNLMSAYTGRDYAAHS